MRTCTTDAIIQKLHTGSSNQLPALLIYANLSSRRNITKENVSLGLFLMPQHRTRAVPIRYCCLEPLSLSCSGGRLDGEFKCRKSRRSCTLPGISFASSSSNHKKWVTALTSTPPFFLGRSSLRITCFERTDSSRGLFEQSMGIRRNACCATSGRSFDGQASVTMDRKCYCSEPSHYVLVGR